MNVAVFGATGGVGRLVVQESLDHGHQVRAVARNPAALAVTHGRLAIVTGDVRDPTAVSRAVAGQDAVVWAVGGHDALRTMLARGTTRSTDLCTVGTTNILAAMDHYAVRRLVAVSSWGVGESRGRVPLLFRFFIFPLILKDELADKERQEALIRMSDLDWTIVRPSRLSDGPKSGRYRTGSALSYHAWAHLSRADLAAYLVSLLAQGEAVRQTLEVSS
jgi:putative NADH-flavin reductase